MYIYTQRCWIFLCIRGLSSQKNACSLPLRLLIHMTRNPPGEPRACFYIFQNIFAGNVLRNRINFIHWILLFGRLAMHAECGTTCFPSLFSSWSDVNKFCFSTLRCSSFFEEKFAEVYHVTFGFDSSWMRKKWGRREHLPFSNIQEVSSECISSILLSMLCISTWVLRNIVHLFDIAFSLHRRQKVHRKLVEHTSSPSFSIDKSPEKIRNYWHTRRRAHFEPGASLTTIAVISSPGFSNATQLCIQ